MKSGPIKYMKARYISSVTVCYLVTLLFVFYIVNPHIIGSPKAQALQSELITQPPPVQIRYGLPVRIVLPDLGIDLPVDKGFYNGSSGEWTLSGNRAHFATLTTVANDYSGNTFIYGHNNKHVFGKLVGNLKPGYKATVYTDTKQVFTYVYVSSTTVQPDDTSVLNYRGPSILTLQTCSGNWFEVRDLYKFKFQKVETRE